MLFSIGTGRTGTYMVSFIPKFLALTFRQNQYHLHAKYLFLPKVASMLVESNCTAPELVGLTAT